MARTILLDLETTRTGRIRHVGAILKGHIFERTKNAGSKAILEALDEFAKSADFILGHNLLGHDFPILKAVSPDLEILKKLVIDTLYLSPLAFPQNPYHRLVKNYKRVRSSISNPVEDAKLALSIFADQWESFMTLAEKKPEVIDFYRFCFEKSVFNTFSGEGIGKVFSEMTFREIQTPDDAFACFVEHTDGIVCSGAIKDTIPEMLARPDRRPIAAYCLAWLQVAG